MIRWPARSRSIIAVPIVAATGRGNLATKQCGVPRRKPFGIVKDGGEIGQAGEQCWGERSKRKPWQHCRMEISCEGFCREGFCRAEKTELLLKGRKAWVWVRLAGVVSAAQRLPEHLCNMPQPMPTRRSCQEFDSSNQVLISHTSVGALRVRRNCARPSTRKVSLAGRMTFMV